MDIPEDLAAHLAEVAPDLLEAFEENYTKPAIRKGICQRCGAQVEDKKRHRWWHRNISLGMYALGASARYLLERGE